MIQLDDEILRKLQLVELELLTEVDRICRENNIEYSLDGGTLLGAVRHQGFIPWDDDADVMMTRVEYEKFYNACKNQLDSKKFFLQEFRTDKEYRWGYSKLRKNNTVFLREGQEKIKCHTGVCIDIFIFDEVPDNFIMRRLHWVQCFIIRKGLYSVVGEDKEKKLWARMVYTIMSKFPRNFWTKWLLQLAQNEENKNRKLVSHLTYPNRKEIRYGVSKDYYNQYVDLMFEGKEFRAIKEYKRYLTELFDDYMLMPPIEKRKIHPVSKLKL